VRTYGFKPTQVGIFPLLYNAYRKLVSDKERIIMKNVLGIFRYFSQMLNVGHLEFSLMKLHVSLDRNDNQISIPANNSLKRSVI